MERRGELAIRGVTDGEMGSAGDKRCGCGSGLNSRRG